MNYTGETPLLIATRTGQDTVVEIILKEAIVRPQRYTYALLASTAHSAMRRAQKLKNDDLVVTSLRIIALLGAEIVASSKCDSAPHSEETAMGHASALRSTLVPQRVSHLSRQIEPHVLTSEGDLYTV
ncbi:hypothetical protein MMC34_001679 [Xylographa carneopallida]|nr:hypothetical protein [Xylographa carneopallida]